MKIHLYVPEEDNCPAKNATIKLPEVPMVGDIISTPELAPALGPGAGCHTFKVTSRMWAVDRLPYLRVTRKFKPED